jgi:hypothetical protein
MDAIETALLGLYLAAARRLGELGQPLLAEIVAQILEQTRNWCHFQ